MIAQADIGLLDGLERALINGRLSMAYQPKISRPTAGSGGSRCGPVG